MRGYQRRVIYLKNPGGEYFDEAYFVVRENLPEDSAREGDMVFEANRIISENLGVKKPMRPHRLFFGIAIFLSGVLLSWGAALALLLTR